MRRSAADPAHGGRRGDRGRLIVACLVAAGVRPTAGDLIHVGRADFGLFQQGASDLTRSLLPGRSSTGSGNPRSLGRLRRSSSASAASRVATPSSSSACARRSSPTGGLVIVGGRRRARAGRPCSATRGEDPCGSARRHPRRSRSSATGRRPLRSGDRFEDIGGVLPLPSSRRWRADPGEVTTYGIAVELGRRPEGGRARGSSSAPGNGGSDRARPGRPGRHVERAV